ncbi:MAG: ABC transporter ATP-binding protein [Fervidobacterium sp.]
MLKVENLSKSFGKLRVIKDISFTLNVGEAVAFLGPSGCGKTSMLRIIAGLDKNYAGNLEKNYSKAGYVFQEPRLIPWKSVEENLYFVCEDRKKIMEILKSLNIEEFADYLPSKLSGGIRQRVNLARALVVEPDILFLDEPFASLDVHTKIGIINDLNEKRKVFRYSMLVVTHDIREALLLADRIILLSDKPSIVLKEFYVSDVPKDIKSAKFQKVESDILSELIRRWSAL